MSYYFTLLACGLFLIGIEIFIPGGILGILGAGALLGAVVIGFRNFPLWLGWLSLFFILALALSAVCIWIRFLPNSPIGKALSLQKSSKPSNETRSPWTLGMTGQTLCNLHPAGKATVQNQRLDVIAENGAYIEADTPIEISRVAGNRIYVREI